MICDYLVHELKMRPLEAIKVFEAARNHRIERENYRHFLIEGKEKEEGDISQYSRKRTSYEDRDDGEHSSKRPRYDHTSNWRQPQYSGRQDTSWRRDDQRNQFSRDDNWRQDRYTARGGRSTEWRDHRPYQQRVSHFSRKEPSSSPEIGAPRIPRTPPRTGDEYAPRSRYSQPRGRGSYYNSIPPHRGNSQTFDRNRTRY